MLCLIAAIYLCLFFGGGLFWDFFSKTYVHVVVCPSICPWSLLFTFTFYSFSFPYKLFYEFYLCLVQFLSDRGSSGSLHFELLLRPAYETK